MVSILKIKLHLCELILNEITYIYLVILYKIPTILILLNLRRELYLVDYSKAHLKIP